MDPYLENPVLWPDVHARFIGVASELLLAQLRPKYFVQIDERVYLADDNDEARAVMIPDMRIREVAFGPSRGPGTLVAAPGLKLGYGFEFEIRESYLKVLDRQSNRVITVIEILSPANKVNTSVGKQTYDQKRRDMLAGRTNFVEIDLLRGGPPLGTKPLMPPWDYMAQVWRFTKTDQTRFIWPMSIREPLQPIPIPVREEDKDAVLDLQHMLNIAYERAAYDLRVDYREAPVPPLEGGTADWAKGIVAGQVAH
jgi:hypothetical protein